MKRILVVLLSISLICLTACTSSNEEHFITVHYTDNTAIYVNTDHIVAIVPNSNGSEIHTDSTASTYGCYYVTETPEELMKMIK